MKIHLRRPSLVLVPLLAGALLCTTSFANAQAGCECACRWDQRNDAFYSGGYSIPFFSPLGQEFVPTTSSLDSIELLVNTQNGPVSEVFVRIRDGHIAGRILGVSSLATGVNHIGFPVALRRFEFDQPVPLTPGSTHVFEVVQVGAGEQTLWLTGYGNDAYPAGRIIANGAPVAKEDFWFRLGSKRDLLGQPDQLNDPIASGGWVLTGTTTFGQGFTPARTYLDVVELMMNLQVASGSGSAFVRIRSGGMSGTVHGTSDVVDVTVPTSAHLRQFRFAQPVPLTPGQPYVMEIVHAGGDPVGVFVTGWGSNSYPFGQAWIGGTPFPDHDFWFRLGGACDPLALEDQVNDPFVSGGWVMSPGTSIGQEFTPADARLDLVELHLNTQSAGTGTAFVRIRSDHIGGRVLGTSAVVAVELGGYPISMRRFRFAQPVPLEPGLRHVLEVVHDSGPSLGVWLTGFGGNTYAGGRAIRSGVPQAGEDLCFRTGSIAEPIGVPDQVNDVPVNGGLVVSGATRAGQQFVPTLSWLDSIELKLNAQAVGTGSAYVKVYHSDGLYGAVRGVSETVEVSVSGLPVSLRRFEFEQPVPLAPGLMHVFEVVHAGGVQLAVWGGGDTYPDGTSLNQSGPRATDFWFRVGGRPDCAYPAAATTVRNAGANPASYSAGPAALGKAWTAKVDLWRTGHSLAEIRAYASPAQHTMPGGQVLLVGGPELFRLPLKPGPLATWNVPVPYDCSLAGLTAFSQAVHVLGVTPYALSNAQDLFIGY